MTSYVTIGLLAVAILPACDFGPQVCEGEVAALDEAPSTPQSRVVAQVLPVESSAVDILFVIDDSKSMTDEQEQLGIWSNELFDVLASSGEMPDLHIGVVSSSVEIPGVSNCTYTGLHVGQARLEGTPYIRDVAGTSGRERNYTGTLTETFAKMALVGDAGCGFEQPFKAARTVLAPTNTATKGFLRDDALLLVVFVTDEDDCSMVGSGLIADEYANGYSDGCSELGPLTSYRCFEHGVTCYDGKGGRALGDRTNCRPDESSQYVESVSGFGESLKRLKKNAGQVIVAGIYGKPNHVTTVPDEKITTYTTPRLADVCGNRGVEGTGATPAVRMNALLAGFGGRASQSSICDSDLSWAMRDVGLVTRSVATRSHCLRGALVDTDASAPGVQPACRMEVATDVGTPEVVRTQLLPCDRVSGSRCFTVESDPRCADTQLAFQVSEPADNETLTVSCDVVVDAPPVSDDLTRAPD